MNDICDKHMQPPSDLLGIEQFLAARVLSVDYEAPGDASSCLTRMSGVDFGSIVVFSHVGKGCRRGLRRMEHIRADHIDDFLISLPIKGKSVFSQAGKELRLDPGHFAVLTTSKPFSISITSEDNHTDFLQYSAIVSGPMLRSRLLRIDDFCDQIIRVTPGAATIMASLFQLAVDDGQKLSESQARVFAEMLIDSIANSMRGVPELANLQVESRQRAYVRIRERAEHFIRSNISNPTLGPKQVAEHCKVSTRYLNEAFALASMTMVSFIRDTRLECCRVALMSPELRDKSVFQIALRWGFNDPAHFSRAYKAKFKSTPREDHLSA